MKKNIKLLFVLVAIIIANVSCDDATDLYTPGDGFVQFSTTSGSVQESADPIQATVLLGAIENTSGVTVNFTVTSDDPSRFTVSPASGTLEIPAGEYSGVITIAPISNLEVDGNVDLTITLDPSSSVGVGIGGEGVNNNTAAFTVIDDDCPIDIDQFVGTFSVTEEITEGGFAGVTLAGAFSESYQLELTRDPSDTAGIKIVVNNSAGFNEYFPEGTVITFNSCPGDVTLDPESPVMAGFNPLVLSMSSYDEEASTISLVGSLRADIPTYEITLTRM